MRNWSTATVHEATKFRECGIVIDVRTPAEFRSCHLPESINVPLDQLNAERLKDLMHEHDLKPGDPGFLLCQSGARARNCAQKINGDSPLHLHVIEGGIKACGESGITLNYGSSRVWELERQVRLAAGMLVVVCVLLGYAAHPAFFGIAGFVGAGLSVAALSGWCGMAQLLSFMPWNRA